MAQILSPSIGSPSFHVFLDAQGCCSSSDNRMVPQGSDTIASESSNRFLACFKKCLCCSSASGQREENKQAVYVYKEYLKQEYLPLEALLSLRMAAIDLSEKGEEGSPLYDFELRTIQKNAEEIKRHLLTLKRMVKQITFHEEMRSSRQIIGEKIKEGKSDKTSSSDHETKNIFSGCVVHKRNGKVEQFQEVKIKTDLEQLSFEAPLSSEQIGRVVKHVKTFLEGREIQSISSKGLREIVINIMKEQGVIVPRPEFLAAIPKRTVARSLTMRRDIEELTGEECSMLIDVINSQLIDR